MDSTGSPLAETSIAWRMGAVEEQYKQLDGKVDKVQTDLTDLKLNFVQQFADLRRDLFESPPFLSHSEFATYKVDRDREVRELKTAIENIKNGGISTTRHYVTLAVAVAGMFIAPFVADYLGRI